LAAGQRDARSTRAFALERMIKVVGQTSVLKNAAVRQCGSAGPSVAGIR